ncbi:hypothetical protein NDU88_010206 [Pleurodeles waltl]|uniref:Uncharacterized protein n=1 Tax=Pleurodeles waltl TaxID=8319 RepID=A0AAV7PY10_PLEWA|nr:hypothetical protein NDU88_010206 [Pleurodeles waltl]
MDQSRDYRACSVFARAQSSSSSQAAPQHAPGSHRHLGVVLLRLPRAGPDPLCGHACAQEWRRSAARRGVSSIGPPGPNQHLRHSGETRLESPAVLGPTAPEPLRPAAQREATISITGRPLYFQGAARIQKRCFAAPRLGASSLGLPGPHRPPAAAGRLVQSPPLFLGHPPSRRIGSRPTARPRLRPPTQASCP